jgi:hypothetical protein
MAKWKEPTTKVTTTGVDPRARMKEIRAEVKAYLKGDILGLAHLGDLPNNMEDARRVIIATQDLLEIEHDKHLKATNHVAELVSILDEMSENQQDLLTMIHQSDIQIYQLNQVVEANEKHGYHMRDEMRQSQHERDALLTVMKLMVMGHSNKDHC